MLGSTHVDAGDLFDEALVQLPLSSELVTEPGLARAMLEL